MDDYYDFDASGNVAAITDARSGAGQRGNRTMAYDGLNRLTDVASPMYGSAGAHYSYDVLDNLTHVVAPGRNHSYYYDGHNRLTNVKSGSATVIGLGYDAQGNLANKNGVIYDFDYGNRLRSVSGGRGVFVYDGLGRRVRDFTTASKYSMYTRAGQLIFASDARKHKQFRYVYLGGSLIGYHQRDLPTSTYSVKYQHTDALGTPVAVTAANRVVLERSEYEPYGRVTNRPMHDGPGYTGHVEDAATGLVYMQQRYYDPGIGRFLSVDPVTATSVGGNFNRYWYANNNPYKFTDPDGRCAASRLQAVCASGMANGIGIQAAATFRQTQMVRVASDGHQSANSAAVKFGNDTQTEAKETKREPQSGIARSGKNNFAYTKPMWGPPNDDIVDVRHYIDALQYVYGSSAIGLAHGHFDDNMKFSPADLAPFKTARNRLFFMHNQNGETRRMDERIFRRTLRDADSSNLMEYLNRHKDGMEGECVGGC